MPRSKNKRRAKGQQPSASTNGGGGPSPQAEAEQRRLREREAAERRATASAEVADEDAASELSEQRIRLKLEAPEKEPAERGLWEFTSDVGSRKAVEAEGPTTEDGQGPEGTAKVERSLGLNVGGAKNRREVTQKGWIQNEEGEDRFESLAYDDDGVEASGIALAEGWTVDVVAKRGEQKLAFGAPTEWIFPPPDGFSLDLLPKVTVPLGAGLSVEASAGLESQMKLEKVVVEAERTTTKEGDDPYQQVTRWKLSGKGAFGATAGANVEVVIVGGVPVLASVSLGARAKADAKLESALEVGGYLDLTQTIPQPGETRQHLSTDGQVTINATAGGSITAVLAAFVGMQVLTFKNELYELSLIDTPLASLEVGGSFGGQYSNGVFSPFFRPLAGTRGIAFEWLLQRYFELRRLDAATKAATESKADVTALKQLKASAGDQGVSVAELLADPGFDRATLVTGTVKTLLLERERLDKRVAARQADIVLLQEALDGPLKEENDKAQALRWAATNWVMGDVASYAKAKASLAKARKDLVSLTAQCDALEPKILVAQAAFVEHLDVDRIDELITAARLKKHETRRENYATYERELEQLRRTHDKERKELDAKIDPLVDRLRVMRVRVRDYDTVGAGEIAAHQQKRIELEKAERKAANRLMNNGNQIVGHERKLERARAAHEAWWATASYFQRMVDGTTSAAITDAEDELERLEAATPGFESAHEQAKARAAEHAKADPQAALVRALGSLEGDLMALERTRVRLEDTYTSEQEALTKLLFGEWTAEQRDAQDATTKREAKKAKYAKQYGEGGSLATPEDERRTTQKKLAATRGR